jgi:DNA-directed RNA polymerase subunit M/transcription elongation factor TFIIS
MTDAIRDVARNHLMEHGCKNEDAIGIEMDIYNLSKSKNYNSDDPDAIDYDEYTTKCKKVIYNLPYVLPLVSLGTLPFPFHQMVRQSDIVLRPDKWKSHIQRSERNRQKKNVRVAASTDQFTCGKCGKKETTYYLRQTRGMDEPETVFITCVNCNNKWRR